MKLTKLAFIMFASMSIIACGGSSNSNDGNSDNASDNTQLTTPVTQQVGCSDSNPYCKESAVPEQCVQTCTDKNTATLGVHTPAKYSVSIETKYYSTNPKGQVGVNKTITSDDDWSADMLIAQGAANDDPRAFLGYHEKSTDLYALYAAWDDTNLYLMVEMPNLQNVEPCSDLDYACDPELPMGIGLRTGKRVTGNGSMADGSGIWTKDKLFYSIADGIDTLLMFHPRLPAVHVPSIFKTNDDGFFSNDRLNGYMVTFDEAGVQRSVARRTLSKHYWGIADNYKGTEGDYATGAYADLLATNEGATGSLYQLTIPLAAIDIDKQWLETNGIGVLVFSTYGQSMMDALPWTPTLVNNASRPYEKDNTTSAEKADFDEYDVRLASIGKLQTAKTATAQSTTNLVCTPAQLPNGCNSNDIKLQVAAVSELTAEDDSEATVTVTVATGYKDVVYEWQATGQDSVTSNYDETTQSFTFKKGVTPKDVKITVTAKAVNGSVTYQGSKTLTVTIPTCSGEACGPTQSIDNEWIKNQDIDKNNIRIYDKDSTCKVAESSIVLKADITSEPNVYLYKDGGSELLGKWPGSSMMKIDGCASTVYQIPVPADSKDALAIFNKVGDERYPADQQPGIDFTTNLPCFDWETKSFTSLDTCGVQVNNPSDSVYILRDGNTVEDGTTIYIREAENNPGSAYVDVSLMIYGVDTNEASRGTYTINGKQGTFINGQILRIGEQIYPNNYDSAQTMVLTVQYGEATATYKFVKVKYQKPSASTKFSWNNALVYFVMTDRFADGNPSNNNSYGRPSEDAKGNTTATFHGGDIKGLTDKLDYIKSLGINAIWLTAPYEQAHGWVGGGSKGEFAYYAYHGYYALDFTSLDANMGTVEEFHNFVTEAHKRGIRVILDVVMNHSGYATLKDMCDYGFGATVNNVDACQEWTPASGQTFHNKPILEQKNPAWDSWWGKDWLIFGGYGDKCGSGDGLNACISFLPDFKNSKPHSPTVNIPQFLTKKWTTPDEEHDVPAAKKYRNGKMSVAEFQAHWLASWVEEFGIDGFRCDTAKHVTKETWKLLKEYSQKALQKWRKKNIESDDPAVNWTDNFWMTGEHWGFRIDPKDNDKYAEKGGFDSMINFTFNSQPNGQCSAPTTALWEQYANYYGVGTGSPKLNALTYVSSHDTSLCRPADMKALGTGLLLLSGGVQVYYGDETVRMNDGGGIKDQEQGTRSDMNFPNDIEKASIWASGVDTLSTNFADDEVLAHWQKIGQFRFRNIAVGAGKQTKTEDGSYCRIYDDVTSGINNTVVIHVGATSVVDVGSCFEDGTELQDAYSGTTATVLGGRVNLPKAGDLILLEIKR